jgi:hypothetical protein
MESKAEHLPNDPRTVERSQPKQPTSYGAQSPPESPNEHSTKHRAITAKATDKPLREAWSDHGLSDQHATPAQRSTHQKWPRRKKIENAF